MPSERAGEPRHEWAGTDDGHDCTSCEPTSIWKCDKPAHESNAVLPPLPPSDLKIKSMDDLLTPAERQKMRADLGEMQRRRRRAESEAAAMTERASRAGLDLRGTDRTQRERTR